MIFASASEEIVLLEKLISGDKFAFEKIYEIHYPTVVPFALRLTKSKQQAEEIAQEVFITIWEKREHINKDLNFRAYLKKITLNLVINFLKKASRNKELQKEIFENMICLQDDGLDMLQEKQVQKIYNEAIGQLPAQKKIIYQLSRNNDFTYTEIATKLNLSKSTVKNHMVEALKMIRRTVGDQIF